MKEGKSGGNPWNEIHPAIGPAIVGGALVAATYPAIIFGYLSDRDNLRQITLEENIQRETGILEERGLVGEHPLVDLREVPMLNPSDNYESGFLTTQITKEGATIPMLKFAWRTKEDLPIQVSQVPVKNVQFVIFDDDNVKPTVLFSGMTAEKFAGSTYVTDSENPNDFVNRVMYDSATIFTLSKKDFENFRENAVK